MTDECNMAQPETSSCGHRLQRLELQGFKSFPDKTVIRFHEGITAIVGPNGSGKSNLADALRWVLGETSSKTLRGEKMEDVVFNGTTERKPLGYAEVSIYLDNADRMFDVDFEELVITRRYYRSGESEYFINKAPVRLRDIRDLFRDTGLGRDGYSVIGQGMITEIIKAKSTERRFLFEEAAGIAGFKFKKEESEHKLALTAENLVRIGDILSELSSRLPALEEKARKARKFLDFREEKKNLELFVWQNQAEEYILEQEKTRRQKETFDQQLKDCAKRAEEIEALIEAQSKKMQEHTLHMEQLQAKKESTDNAAGAKEAEALLARNDIEHLQKESERILRDRDQVRSGKEQLEEQIRQEEEALAGYQARQEALHRETEEIFRTRDTLLREEESYQKDADIRKQEETDADARLTKLQIQLAAAQQAQADGNEKIQKLRQEKADGEERRKILQNGLNNCTDRLIRAESILADNKNKAVGYELKQNNLKQKQSKTEISIREKQLALGEKTARLQLLTDMEKHFEGFSHAVRTVMQEVERGTLKGNMATVASVITPNEGCAVAVEIALGSGMQNIITDKEEDAKQAMLLLKNRNAGRATFLPLSAIRGTRLSAPGLEQSQGFVGLACDLVQYDPRYELAIVSLLGRTAITETLDDAISLSSAFRRSFKIVTLDGQVVNAGGSMTGGSVSRQTGILSRRSEIVRLEEECAAQKDTLNEEEKRLQQQTEELKELTALLTSLQGESAEAQAECIRQQTQKDSLTASLDTVERQLIVLEEEERRLIGQETLRQEEILRCQEKIQTAVLQRAQGKKSTEETEALFAELRKKQEEIAEKAHGLQLQILEEEKNAQQARNRIEEFRKRDEEWNATGQSAEKEQQALILAIKQKQCCLELAEKEKTALNKQAEELAVQLRQIAGARNEAEREQIRLRKEENQLHEQREGLARESERAAARWNQIEESSRQLLSRLWDEYELTLTEVKALRLHFDLPFARRRTEELKEQIKALGHVDLSSVEEYTAVRERHRTLSAQYDDLTRAKAELEKIIAQLSESMADIFREQLATINEAFGKTFREMFNGGEARLTLEDPGNILESGVEIYAAPPGKIIKNLVSLSGGEQALTAIALYFAILRIRPAPFCLLDEIEAALDDVNVQRFSRYLHRLAANTQFVTITHRRGTMEQADKLYGVTMVDKGISRVITIDVSEISSLNLEKE